MLEFQGIMAWVNGILIGASVSVAGFMALIGAFKLITSGSDQRKHEEGITTLRNVGIGILVMALVIPAVNVGASRLGLGTIAEPEVGVTPTAEIGNISVPSTTQVAINYNKTIRLTNEADLKLAIQNLTTQTFSELDLTASIGDGEHQTLTFLMVAANAAANNNIRILGYRYGTATIVDAASGDPAVSTFSQQQYTVP